MLKANPIIAKLNKPEFPFKWADTEYLPNSRAERKEIYTLRDEDLVAELGLLFYSLFSNRKTEMVIYHKSWWDFCLAIWNPSNDVYDYGIGNKSEECKSYLEMLMAADIEQGYEGCCKCLNWDAFLSIILRCIIGHHAPYSPIFCDEDYKYFFIFIIAVV